MADGDVNTTRSVDMEEGETTSTDSSLILIGSRDRGGGRDQTIGALDLETRIADLCTRLPPPPIPHWLESSSERLRKLMANCSCWEKYTELCSDHIPTQDASSGTRMEDLHSNGRYNQDNTMSRLLPFVAAMTVGLLMVGVVALSYFWHQRKRRKTPCTATFKYQKQTPSPSRDYCSPGFYLTPSVTMETQLSLCALEDDIYQTRPYSICREEAWPCLIDVPHLATPRSGMESSSPPVHGDSEILLQPHQLEENEREPFYASPQPVFCGGFNSSLSQQPGERAREGGNKKKQPSHRKESKLKDRLRQSHASQNRHSLTLNDMHSPYVQIQSLHDFPSATYEECDPPVQPEPSERTNRDGRRGVVRKCREAGNRVLDKLPWKNGAKPSNHSAISNRRFDRPIRALRLSLKSLRSLGHRRLPHTPDTCVTSPSNLTESPGRASIHLSDGDTIGH